MKDRKIVIAQAESAKMGGPIWTKFNVTRVDPEDMTAEVGGTASYAYLDISKEADLGVLLKHISDTYGNLGFLAK